MSARSMLGRVCFPGACARRPGHVTVIVTFRLALEGAPYLVLGFCGRMAPFVALSRHRSRARSSGKQDHYHALPRPKLTVQCLLSGHRIYGSIPARPLQGAFPWTNHGAPDLKLLPNPEQHTLPARTGMNRRIMFTKSAEHNERKSAVTCDKHWPPWRCPNRSVIAPRAVCLSVTP